MPERQAGVGPKNHQAWWFLLAFCALWLSGCGFKLKGLGTTSVTFQTVHLQVDGARADVHQALETMLRASDVVLVESLADADVRIRLGATQYKTTRTSLSGTGDTGSELITMTQPFSSEQVATEQSLVNGEASSYRDRRIEAGGLAAASQELESLRTQMANELAMQILDRVQRAYQAERPTTTDAPKTSQTREPPMPESAP